MSKTARLFAFSYRGEEQRTNDMARSFYLQEASTGHQLLNARKPTSHGIAEVHPDSGDAPAPSFFDQNARGNLRNPFLSPAPFTAGCSQNRGVLWCREVKAPAVLSEKLHIGK